MNSCLHATECNEPDQPQTKILIGGTFDALHIGHQEYIKFALQQADELLIMLSSDKYIANLKKGKKKYRVKKFKKRAARLHSFIDSLHFNKPVLIEPLFSLNQLQHVFTNGSKITHVVAIPEYLDLFKKYNYTRKKTGKPAVKIVPMKLVCTKNGAKISSTAVNCQAFFPRLWYKIRFRTYPVHINSFFQLGCKFYSQIFQKFIVLLRR